MGFFSSIIKPVVGAGIGLMTGGLGGAAVGAGLGLLGNSSDSKQQAAYNQQMDFAQQQFDFQKDYAKSVMQWRVEDAKKAGVHPMAALGMSSPSFSPVSSPAYTPSDSFDPMELGQSINYAATKAKSRQQQAQMVNLQMRGLELDNEYKQALIDNMKVDTLAASIASNQAFDSPAAPTLNAKEPVEDVKFVPDEVIRAGDNPSATAGTHPLWTHARSGDFIVPVLSDKLADAVTENKEKHLSAEVTYAYSAWNGRIKPPISALTPHEQYLIKTGEYDLFYYPMLGWLVAPKVNVRNFRKFLNGGYRKGPSVSGKIVR